MFAVQAAEARLGTRLLYARASAHTDNHAHISTAVLISLFIQKDKLKLAGIHLSQPEFNRKS